MQISVHLGNWQQVLNYYSKAEATPEMTDVSDVMQLATPRIHHSPLSLYKHTHIHVHTHVPQSTKSQLPGNQEMATRLRCAAGLAEMENRKYKNAARLFLQASFEHCKCSDVRLGTMACN